MAVDFIKLTAVSVLNGQTCFQCHRRISYQKNNSYLELGFTQAEQVVKIQTIKQTSNKVVVEKLDSLITKQQKLAFFILTEKLK